MKVLINSTVDNLTFVRDVDYVNNSFELVFTKTVGTDTLTLSALTDSNALASCFPYITLEVDLVTNVIPNGEYLVTLNYGGTEYDSCLLLVRDAYPDAVGGGDDLYEHGVILS
jgi:hypothetical protein